MTRRDPRVSGGPDDSTAIVASGPPTLFEAHETAATTRRSDPQTSVDAARGVDLGGQRDVVLAALDREGQVTADRLEELTGVHRSTWSTRLAGMRRDGLVVEVGPVQATNATTGRTRRVLAFRRSLAIR